MFRKLFGIREEILFSPISGKVIKIEEVPDPAFAQKMMGEGVAIEPNEGKVTSPVNGKVIQVFPTKHAVGILSETGLEILIHIGLDTVTMNGEGFVAHVKEGDQVKVGQPLINFSLDLVKEKATSSITPMVITNSDLIDQLHVEPHLHVTNGEIPLLKVRVKI
jgi:PTS system glucose-specific IIA component